MGKRKTKGAKPGDVAALKDEGRARMGKGDALAIALIAIAVGVCYAGAVHGGFVSDDRFFVKDNRVIRQVWPIERFFTEREAYSPPDAEYGIYRPLTPMSYALELKAHGMEVEGFHLTNIALHGLCAIMVFVVLREIIGSTWAAGGLALIFAVHPANTESVTWIGQRAGLLSLLFFLIAVRLHVGARRSSRGTGWKLAGVAGLYALSAFSKEMGITLPAVLLMYDLMLVSREKRPNWKRMAVYYGVLAGVGGAYLAARTWQLGTLSQQAWHGETMYHNALLVIASLGFYARLAVWPTGLSLEYGGESPMSMMDGAVIAGVGTAIVLAAVAWAFWRVERRVTFGIGWFVVTLLPVINIVPIMTTYNDRFLYAPLVGMCVAVGGAIVLVARYRVAWMRVAMAGAVVAAISAGAYGTIERNKDWESHVKLLEAAVRVNERNEKVLQQLGVEYLNRKDYAKARDYLEKAAGVNPEHGGPKLALGICYYDEGDQLIRAGKVEEGEAKYAKAMELMIPAAEKSKGDKLLGMAKYCQGNICGYRGKMSEAKALFEEAIRLDPYCARAYENLALMLMAGDGDDRKEAGRLIAEAHRIAMNDAVTAKNAMMILCALGRPGDALRMAGETMAELPVDSAERRELAVYATRVKQQMEGSNRGMRRP